MRLSTTPCSAFVTTDDPDAVQGSTDALPPWCGTNRGTRLCAHLPELREQAVKGSPRADSTGILSLRLIPIGRAFREEGVAFWLLCTYLMFEYVRPQSLYPVIDVFPWPTATMALTALAAIAARKTVRIATPANLLLVVFSFVLVLSSITAYRPAAAYEKFEDFFLWMLAYFLITQIVVTERRMFLLMLAFVLFNLKMSLFATRSWISIGFVFRDWGVGGAPGFFSNSGEFGIEMCVFLPIVTYMAIGLRPYLAPWKFAALLAISGTALTGMIASSSRGALLGGSAVIAFMLARSRHRVRALVVAVVLLSGGYLAIPAQQKARLAASGEDKTSTDRLTFWRHGIEMANEYPVLGIGYSNWMPYYRDHYTAGPKLLPHNIFIQAVSELGYTGLVAFLLLIGCTFVINSRSRALAIRAGPAGRLTYHLALGLDGALIGFLVSGFFVTVLYYPYFWINLSMTVALSTVAKQLPIAARETPHAVDPPASEPVLRAIPPALSGRRSATSARA